MTMGRLATHVADMFYWFMPTLEADELDFAKGYNESKPATAEEINRDFRQKCRGGDGNFAECGRRGFYEKIGTLRNGEEIYFTMPKIGVVRAIDL